MHWWFPSALAIQMYAQQQKMYVHPLFHYLIYLNFFKFCSHTQWSFNSSYPIHFTKSLYYFCCSLQKKISAFFIHICWNLAAWLFVLRLCKFSPFFLERIIALIFGFIYDCEKIVYRKKYLYALGMAAVTVLPLSNFIRKTKSDEWPRMEDEKKR